ncbi:MAG: hypothetical protein JRI68_18015 [Deltaproteobacteria bacterium]|nr:hypothetical protein [Deltaproteobacteria bacterium]
MAAALLVVGLTGAGCSDKAAEAEGNAKRAAATSAADATSPIRDEAYRFELTLPGPRWKLLHEADASRLTPDALAGALSDGEVTGVVLVDRAVKIPLEQIAKERIARLALTDKHVERDASESFAGKDARHFVVTGKVAGVGLRYASRLLVHQDWVYQVLAWAPHDEASADGSLFAPVFEAFSLLEGAVTGRNDPQPTADCRGVGWRVKDNLFESAVGRLRVKPVAGWRLAVGGELALLNPQADVGLVGTDTATSIVLLAERVPGMDLGKLSAQLKRDVVTKLKPAGDPQSREAKVAGRTVTFDRHRAGSFHYDHGILMDGDLCLQVLARAPVAEGGGTAEAVTAGLGAIELLSPAQADTLAKELDEQATSQVAIGKAYSIRGGVFRDFERDITWTSSSSDWRMMGGEQARWVNPDAVLYLENRRAGLHGLLITEKAGDLDVPAYHRRVVDRLQVMVAFAPTSAKASVGDLEAMASEGEAVVVGDTLRYRIVTTLRGQLALQALVWGTPRAMATHANEATAVAAGLELQGGLTAVAATTDAYRDNRLGFTMMLPPRWQHRDLTTPELADFGTMVRWELEGRWIGVAAAYVLDAGRDEQWLVSFLEQLLRDELGPLTRGAPAQTETTLAGKSARHVHWTALMQRVDALLVSQGGVIYAVVTVDSGDGALKEAERGFGLLK